jgi:hypothetical protein
MSVRIGVEETGQQGYSSTWQGPDSKEGGAILCAFGWCVDPFVCCQREGLARCPEKKVVALCFSEPQ